ncbi:MAG: TonB-dependent receptor [Helicobacteraceae bacterium]|nr:TonB-dependent receptor [Candidatus Sulfurimonas ponti]
MKKIIPLSLVAILSLSAAEIELAPIGVESTVITEVAENAQISADVAEALSGNIPSIDMNRRSGIANDIYIRGQKRDNISVEVDGTKVCGACPNRMDPPVSHVLANQIEEIEVTEGPYDVTTFGTMSGGLKITTKKPSKEFKGEINAGAGSWGYKKIGATVSGGNDTIRVLVTGSTESSGQYEDGDGNTLSQQTKNSAPTPNQYQAQYENMDAYEKKSVNAKAFINLMDNHELRLSYTGNRSDNILYPNTSMDAIYDDSNIYSIEYNIANLTNSYKNLNLQYYYSDVDHPMSTEYRKSALMMKMVSQLQTEMKGLKLKNDFDLDGTKVTLGLDASERVWDGKYYLNDNLMTGATQTSTSINNATTKNKAVFVTTEKQFGNLNVKAGARYDWSSVKSDDTSMQNNDYNALNANIFTTYALNDTSSIFLGVGQASRVPDARELYFKKNKVVSTMPTVWAVVTQGNDTLKDTTNREIDLGYELKNDTMNFKVKGFYSDLKDYIYFSGSTFTNIDAKVYGGEISSDFFVTDTLTVDASASYKRGKKDHALVGETDTDLADIAPLKATVGMTYEYASNSSLRAEIVSSDAWDTFDSDNGEQKLSGWSIVNLKAKHAFGKTIDLTVGANNIFDKTFAQTNTYVDLTLLSAGTDTMLLNEPGRYLYTNLTYKF